MKFHALAGSMAALAAATFLTGCEYPNGEPNNTGTGALVGGGFGALAGAAVGGRNAGPAAFVGGVMGAIAGSIVGNSMDEAQAERLQAEAPRTYVRIEQRQPLQVADVKALAQAGVSDDVIIAQIQNSHTVYHLTAVDIIGLHQAGVSDRVVNFMIQTARSGGAAGATTVVETAPPPPPAEVYVAPPGPDYVWVAGQWQWNGAAWVWVRGYWSLPPARGAVWVDGGWYHGPGGWYHRPGHWRRW
ncbi:MAG: YXWGXW repeat-containing protein [Verrucomicrobia bacterium]|nr:YXWGXW repeat-containing protein [Verrucomicrobiota bacterium]MDE3100549.1 YXWGXW repeat-containing protein [Verrucomicrobiota bacterium]